MKQPDAAKTLRIRVYGLSECRLALSTIPARFGIDCRSRAGIQIRRRSLRLNEHFWQLAFRCNGFEQKNPSVARSGRVRRETKAATQ
jgi:hypothetical protein